MNLQKKVLFNLMNHNLLIKYLKYENGNLIVIKQGAGSGRFRPPGSVIGKTNGHRYKHAVVFQKRYYIHRLIWFYHFKYWPKFIDHVNGNALDNRIENLRECTHSQNHANRRNIKRSPCGYRGVNARINKTAPKTFYAGIMVKQKHIYLGTFKTPREAAKAYNVAAKKYFGDFACLNRL